jgi:regulator of protease activity HflC (stomatin/prohibitin superfamily)
VEPLFWALAILLVILVVGVLIRSQLDLATVRDYERGLRFRRGRLEGVMGPGTYLTIRTFGDEVRVLDARPETVTVDGQEILTSDGIAAKVSLVARWVLGDPVAAVTRDADFRRSLYLQLQLALRDSIARRTLAVALDERSQLGIEVREACVERMADIGIELLAVDVRDVMLPAELKRAFAGVVAARKAGEADLERTRAETASLRGLANASRMLDDNPALLQLRLLQELGEGSGHTIVYGAPELPGQAARPARRRPAAREALSGDGEAPPRG